MTEPDRLLIDLENKNLLFTQVRKGYGRAGLYFNGHHVMDVYPNIEEHFRIEPMGTACYDEQNSIYLGSSGDPLEGVYSNLDEWLCVKLHDQIEDIILNIQA